MKQKKLLFSLLVICLLFGFTSCVEEDKSVFGDDFEIPELTDENTIQFTVNVNSDWKQIEVIGGGGRMAIEWGDGRLQKIADPQRMAVTYRYGNQKQYRVRIWAEELTFCNIGSALISVSNLQLGYFPQMEDVLLNSFAGTAELNVSASFPNAKVINIGNWSDLERVDLSGCSNLETVYLYTNPKLNSLKFGQHPHLRTLSLSSNGLQTLSLKGLPALKDVDCWNSPELSMLELDDHCSITSLNLNDCNFESAPFLNKMPFLNTLFFNANRLTQLDVSQNTKLAHLDCSENELESLLLPAKDNNCMRLLLCNSNKLSASALNRVFAALNDVSMSSRPKEYRVGFYENPGEETCDKLSVEQKGWDIQKTGIYGK